MKLNINSFSLLKNEKSFSYFFKYDMENSTH